MAAVCFWLRDASGEEHRIQRPHLCDPSPTSYQPPRKWHVLVCSRSPSDLAVDEEELIVSGRQGASSLPGTPAPLGAEVMQQPESMRSETSLGAGPRIGMRFALRWEPSRSLHMTQAKTSIVRSDQKRAFQACSLSLGGSHGFYTEVVMASRSRCCCRGNCSGSELTRKSMCCLGYHRESDGLQALSLNLGLVNSSCA